MYSWRDTSLKFVPILTTPLGVWFGWWLNDRTDKSTQRTDLIRRVGDGIAVCKMIKFEVIAGSKELER